MASLLKQNMESFILKSRFRLLTNEKLSQNSVMRSGSIGSSLALGVHSHISLHFILKGKCVPFAPSKVRANQGQTSLLLRDPRVACWTRGLSNVVAPVPAKSKLQYDVMWMKWCGNSLSEQRYLPLYTLTLHPVSPGPSPIPPTSIQGGRGETTSCGILHVPHKPEITRGTSASARVNIIMPSHRNVLGMYVRCVFPTSFVFV